MAKKPLPAALIGILVLLIGAALIWSAGFLYWHVRISRAIASTRHEVRMFAADSWDFNPEFKSAGSRSAPYLLAELRRAIDKQDRALGIRMSQEFAGYIRVVYDYLDSPYSVPQATYIKSTASVKDLERALKACEDYWANEKPHFPPWWAWWSGTRRKP